MRNLRHLFAQRANAARDDSGIALVVAMGVALIGITVASVVIAQTIIAASDSGRDRLRTTEVHSAEAAIDATMAELEMSSPCGAPSFSPITYGAGTQKTKVTVVIDYYSAAVTGKIGCTGGVLNSLPDRAVVTATSVGTGTGLGIQPQRKVQAELNLTPRVSLSNNAAIYSAANLTTSTGLKLSPALAGQNADVWIDTGSWYCNVPTSITGGLYVPAGTLKFNYGCYISGDTWVQSGMSLSGAYASPQDTIGGNLTVRDGNLTYNPSNNWHVGGDVTVGGTESSGSGRQLIAGGVKKSGVGAASIPNILPVGIPQIAYKASDWTAKGFTPKSKADFVTWMNGQWGLTQSWETGYAANCDVEGWLKPGVPLKFPSVSTVWDLRSCPTFTVNNNITLEFYADTAIFVTSYNSTGTVIFKSGDGLPHHVWIIAPIAGGGYSPGNIVSSPEMSVQSPLETFWYTPKTLELKSASSIRGQVYGGTVSMSSPVSFEYTDVGVPGVSLVSAAQTSTGFVVELKYKREVS